MSYTCVLLKGFTTYLQFFLFFIIWRISCIHSNRCEGTREYCRPTSPVSQVKPVEADSRLYILNIQIIYRYNLSEK